MATAAPAPGVATTTTTTTAAWQRTATRGPGWITQLPTRAQGTFEVDFVFGHHTFFCYDY